jgi:methyltransferase
MTFPGSATLPAGPLILVAAMSCVRLLELRVARRNTRRATALGGVEYGRRLHPVMIVLHVGLLTSILAETALAHRPFVPALGGPALAVVILAQAGRWRCMRCLGPRWNTRIIVVPGMPLVPHGPYRRLRHPNYLVVAAEGIALPLVCTAWSTALLFTLVNTVFLAVWIRVENAALAEGEHVKFQPASPASARARRASRWVSTLGRKPQ